VRPTKITCRYTRTRPTAPCVVIGTSSGARVRRQGVVGGSRAGAPPRFEHSAPEHRRCRRGAPQSPSFRMGSRAQRRRNDSPPPARTIRLRASRGGSRRFYSI
jgi:hypothetical protein